MTDGVNKQAAGWTKVRLYTISNIYPYLLLSMFLPLRTEFEGAVVEFSSYDIEMLPFDRI